MVQVHPWGGAGNSRRQRCGRLSSCAFCSQRPVHRPKGARQRSGHAHTHTRTLLSPPAVASRVPVASMCAEKMGAPACARCCACCGVRAQPCCVAAAGHSEHCGPSALELPPSPSWRTQEGLSRIIAVPAAAAPGLPGGSLSLKKSPSAHQSHSGACSWPHTPARAHVQVCARVRSGSQARQGAAHACDHPFGS